MRHSSSTARTTAALFGLAGMLALSACGGQADQEGAGTPTAPPEVAQSPTTGAAEEATSTPTMAGGTETAATASAAYTATLQDVDGGEVGTVQVSEVDDALEFHVEATGLTSGFYGLHIHGIGECEPESAAPDDPEDTGAFLSAGGHLGADDAEHPDHAGDLPSLLVQESGDAYLVFRTDRLTGDDLTDEDGAAMMLHSGRDNYAHIPERYAPEGPDDDTTSTGDAGNRLACGVVEAAA